MKYQDELNIALKAMNEVRDVILSIYNSSNMGVEIKEDNSPVTKADKAADEIIRRVLHDAFPSYAMLTEESLDNKERLSNDYCFIVDPIDGTKDFVAHNDEFTVNIALSYKHEVVLGVILVPVSGDIYYAVKDEGSYYVHNDVTTRIYANKKQADLTVLTSRFHINDLERNMIKKHEDKIKHIETVGSTLKGCFIARGLAEISYRFSSNTKEWDTAAMQIVLEESGAHLLKFDGTPIRYNREDVYNRDGYVICNCKCNFLL